MTAQAQLVLDARAATGRSVQVIKPFMHSSTRPQAFSANSLGKVTLSLLLLDSWSLSLRCLRSPPLPSFLPSFLYHEMHCLARSHLSFFTLIQSYFSYWFSVFPLTHSHLLTHSLLKTLTRSTRKPVHAWIVTVPLPLSSTPSHFPPILRTWVLPHPTQRQRKACAPWMAAQSCS